MTILDVDKLYKKFDKDGERKVRENLDAGRYNEKKAVAASGWLQSLDAKRKEGKDRKNAELLERQVESGEQSNVWQKWLVVIGVFTVMLMIAALIF